MVPVCIKERNQILISFKVSFTLQGPFHWTLLHHINMTLIVSCTLSHQPIWHFLDWTDTPDQRWESQIIIQIEVISGVWFLWFPVHKLKAGGLATLNSCWSAEGCRAAGGEAPQAPGLQPEWIFGGQGDMGSSSYARITGGHWPDVRTLEAMNN